MKTAETLAKLTPNVALALVLATAGSHPAFALATNITGGIDPGVGMQAVISWFLAGVAAIAIVGITTFKGIHAVAEGRSLGPHLASGLFGTALCFGGGYALASF